MKTPDISVLAVFALAAALFALDPRFVTAAPPSLDAGAKAALNTRGMRVTHEGTTRYVCDDNPVLTPHALTLECPNGLAVGARVRLAMDGFRVAHGGLPMRSWVLKGVETKGGGKMAVVVNAFNIDPYDGVKDLYAIHRTHIAGEPQGFGVIEAQVKEPLPRGASVVIRLDGMVGIGNSGPVHGSIRLDVAGPGQKEFQRVGVPVKLELAANKPVQVEVRVKSIADATGRVPISIFVSDRFGNLATPPAAGEVRLEAVGGDFDGLPAKLDWAQAKNGLLQVDGVRLKGNAPGRIKVKDAATGSDMTSPAALPAPIRGSRHYFGDVHFHTAFSLDATRPMPATYAFGRDFLLLDVLIGSDHSPWDWWKQILAINNALHKPGRLVTFPAFEASMATGHMNVYFRSPDADLMRFRSEGKSHVASQLNGPRDLITAPHATMSVGHPDFKWKKIGQRMRLVEMIQTRGCSEAAQADEKWGINPRQSPGYDGSLRAMLGRGWHIGFYGGSDNHMGYPTRHQDDLRASPFPPALKGSKNRHYCAMTGFVVKELTRDAIWQAMDQRHVYATSGMPIICHVEINGALMGSEIKAKAGQPVKLYAQLHGTAPIERVEIISGGQCLKSWEPGKLDVEIKESLSAPPAGRETYYYLRLLQTDGHRAWASPVWVTVP